MSIGFGAPLQTTVLNRASCVGDTVTYTCTVSGNGHDWTIEPPGSSVISASITRRFPDFPRPGNPPSPFIINTTSDVSSSLATVLTVTAFAGLNGTRISCVDVIDVSGDLQEATAAVFGEFQG